MGDSSGRAKWWGVGVSIVALALLAGVGFRVWSAMSEGEASGRPESSGPVPVQVASVERGRIEERRVFSGTLLPWAQVSVAAKVGGRVERLAVDLADAVQRGAVVAELDSEEYEQQAAQARAELRVAEAERTAAENALRIAERELERQTTLRDQGVASETQFDRVRADLLAAQSQVAVSEAQVARAEAALANAQTRLDYTQVRAAWDGPDTQRFVSRRWVESGDTVSANAALLTIVQIDPLKAELTVTERDYAGLSAGQPVTLRVDAYPGQIFEGEVLHVSPVFDADSRQARVELRVPNEDGLLKPGMFVRASAVLGVADDATIVPEEALVRRNDRDTVFVADAQTNTARLRPVQIGIRDEGRVQVLGEGVAGQVVTLGQQLLDDGSPLRIVQPPTGQTPTQSEADVEATRDDTAPDGMAPTGTHTRGDTSAASTSAASTSGVSTSGGGVR